MRRPVAVLFRIAVVITAVLGVHLTTRDSSFTASLAYFTIQSNVLVAAVFAWSASATWRGAGHPPTWLKGGTTLSIAITGLVYNLVLADLPVAPHASPIWHLSNQVVHVVTPIAATVDWLLFDEHRRFRFSHAFAWLAYPFGYLGFALVRATTVDGPHRYPYPFLDVDVLGWDGLALNVLLYGGAFWLLGLALVLIDRALPRNAPPAPVPAEPTRAAVSRSAGSDIC
ncbi:hypothetical protein GCM10011581_35130 [Saccharopolyspora subtropica]|uniref:Integral membrane regulator n=1 Tax=Saccharopolyspora thermophila TaxID=89367 RepID=A0A917K2E2_9PSEU|nr:Pr6Pr family membrane protein [Saccharopolyspora subtropica]GGI94952.1 hypothetical protein GCM10011581_35130 [Saccharopolyspora subtropica]